MAIDANENYTLTGAQVEDLAYRIKTSGGDSYTAGNGIDITIGPPGTPSTISIDDTVVAELSDIPTVNDATLTIQHNGTNVQTFTANQSTNTTANVETIYADPIQSTSALTPPVQTNMIADGAITPEKLKGYSTANTTDTWVPVSTGTSEIQHRVIAPFNADGTIPPSAIGWSSFYVSAPTPASNVAVNNTKTNIQSITLGAGKWRVCWGYRYAHSTSSTKYIETGLRYGTTDLLSSATNVPTDGNGDCRVLIAQSMEVNPTGTVTYSSWINNAPANTNGNCPNTSCYLYALRVG